MHIHQGEKRERKNPKIKMITLNGTNRSIPLIKAQMLCARRCTVVVTFRGCVLVVVVWVVQASASVCV